MQLATEQASKCRIKDGRHEEWLEEHDAQYVKMNELTFEHSGGTCAEAEASSLDELRSILDRETTAIRRSILWRHTTAILLVRGEHGWTREERIGAKREHGGLWAGPPDGNISRQVEIAFKGLPTLEATLDELEDLRGLEFQMVFVLLPLDYLRRLRTGLDGLSTAEL